MLGLVTRTPTAREQAHAEIRRRILDVARAQLRAQGASQLSLRSVIAEVGMVSSVIYRYFPSRDAVLTALIVETYGGLARALRATPDPPDHSRRARFVALSTTFLRWGSEHREDFSLLYGTPVRGYQAPEETIAPAAEVVAPFFEAMAQAETAGQATPVPVDGALEQQVAAFATDGLTAAGVTGAIAALTLLVGGLTLHHGGHYVGSFEPFEAFAGRLAADATALAGLGRD